MSEIPPFTGFPRKALKFLEELAVNNNREWFTENKPDYQEQVLRPGQSFVSDLGKKLKSISKGIQFDTQTNGRGSILRIHRDIRFSKDKTPYNTRFRARFWEGPGKKKEMPGFFFGMSSKDAGTSVGMWGFTKETLQHYRDAVIDQKTGKKLEKAIEKVKAVGDYPIEHKHYKRVPRGFDGDHSRAGLLLFNGLYSHGPKIKKTTLTKPELVDVVFQHFKDMSPLQKWCVSLIEGTML